MTTSIATKTVPLLDLTAQHREIRDEILTELIRVIDSQKFILGDEVKQLEQAIAPYCGAKYAIGCASGSDALFLALLALDLQPGDEILTTPYTFFATVGAICRAGAVPVFVDIEPETFNMDMGLLTATLDAHPKVRAIIPIHLFGGCADMDPLCSIAAARGILVIEDAAHPSVLNIKDGVPAVSAIWRASVFSLARTLADMAMGACLLLTTPSWPSG